MSSIWWNNAERREFRALPGDISTDVLVVGGGMTGILCAYMLHRAGVDYALVEADRICSGITKNTTAKITYQHGLIYDKMIRQFDAETARLYLEANKQAMREYGRICKGVDCDYETRPSFVYSLDDRKSLEREVAALRRIGEYACLASDLTLPVSAVGAVRVDDQAQFNPLKFAFAITEGLRIYENTKVLELGPRGAVTDKGKISAKKIIVATHFPYLNKHGGYFIKMYQHRSYVIALKNAADVGGIYVDENHKGMSFRNYGDLLLLGGGGHRTGKKGGGWRELESFARREYPRSEVVGRFATQDCMTLDGIPYIGEYSSGTDGLYVATGYNKWGMTSSMVAAMLLCDMVRGKDNKYKGVFCPSRSMLRPTLLSNTAEALLGLITPTAPRCPHMGCALKYNKEERTWDCPCHGSRFGEDGKLIDNPATDDKQM